MLVNGFDIILDIFDKVEFRWEHWRLSNVQSGFKCLVDILWASCLVGLRLDVVDVCKQPNQGCNKTLYKKIVRPLAVVCAALLAALTSRRRPLL